MKNIIREMPTDELHGRTLYSIKFVEDSDIKEKIILDIGCGFGWFELNALSRNCSHITGIELSQEDLNTANNHIHNTRVIFKIGKATKLPFENACFDTVVCWEVLEHIPEKSEMQMFQEVHRVLKQGGVFYLSTPFNFFISKIFDPAWWLIGHRHYGKKELISFAKNNGFEIDKIVMNGRWWEIISINNLYVAKWIFRRRPFLEFFINKKRDKENEEERGFANIFIKLRKA